MTESTLKNGGRNLLVAGAAAWCGAILLAPAIDSAALYAFFAAICHQDPARSWHLGGGPLAACIRCFSIYSGFLLALLIQLPPRRGLLWAAVAGLGAEFLLERLSGLELEALRAGSGLFFGLAAAGFVRQGVAELLAGRARMPAGSPS